MTSWNCRYHKCIDKFFVILIKMRFFGAKKLTNSININKRNRVEKCLGVIVHSSNRNNILRYYNTFFLPNPGLPSSIGVKDADKFSRNAETWQSYPIKSIPSSTSNSRPKAGGNFSSKSEN
jgi:hypothetical protein